MTSLLSKIQARVVGRMGMLSSTPYTPEWLAFTLLAERPIRDIRPYKKEDMGSVLPIWAASALDKPLSGAQIQALIWLDKDKNRHSPPHRQTKNDESGYNSLLPQEHNPSLQKMFDVLAAEGKWKLCYSILKEHPNTLENSGLLVSALSKIPSEQWPSPQHPMFAMCASEGGAFLTNKILNLDKLVRTNPNFSDQFGQTAIADFNALTQILNHMAPVENKGTWSDRAIPESIQLLEECEALKAYPGAYGAFDQYRQTVESMPNRILRDRLGGVVSTVRTEAFASPVQEPKPSGPDIKM